VFLFFVFLFFKEKYKTFCTLISSKNGKKNTEKKFRILKQNKTKQNKNKEMRIPIELVRAILKINEDYFFLVSKSSVCFVPLKKILAIPKGTTKETFGNTFRQILIYLPIVGRQKSFVLYFCWFTLTNSYYSEKNVNLLQEGVHREFYRYR
jgi:hypothetical protein